MAAAGLNERLHVTDVITIRDGDAFVSMIAFIVRARDVRTPLFSLISSASSCNILIGWKAGEAH